MINGIKINKITKILNFKIVNRLGNKWFKKMNQSIFYNLKFIISKRSFRRRKIIERWNLKWNRGFRKNEKTKIRMVW